MATMYPPELMLTEGRHGEYLVYTLLRDALTEPSWHVFYNLRFHLDSSGTRTREVDFVVLHPDRGCLLIEVKGGEYVHDSARGWCRVYRGELQPDTQHGGPFQQIESAGFALIRAMSEAFRWTPKDVPFAWGTAVAFPHCTLRRVDGRLPADAAGDIIAEEAVFDSPQRVRAWVLRRLGQINGAFPSKGKAFRECFEKVIRSFFAPRVDSTSRLASHIARTKLLEPMLTSEQRTVVRLLVAQPRALIAGFAGTGKTFMAVHRAVSLFDAAPKDAKPRVLLVCFNANLASHIRQEMLPTDATIDAMHFHAVCERMAEEAALPVPVQRNQEYFETGCVELLEEAFCTGKLRPYDAIIVDEGQDFRPRWIEGLEQTLLKADGQMVVLYDPFQDIYGVGAKLPARFGKPFPVTTNCRNTKAICRFLRGTNPTALRTMEPSEFALEGLEPTVITYRTDQDQLQELGKLVRRLIDEHDLLPSQIALLSPFRREHTCLATVDRLAGFRLVDCGRRYSVTDRNCVYYETIKSFKGLEAPCVIVHDLGVKIDPDNLASLYVAFSRGRFALYVLRQPGAVLPHEIHQAAQTAQG